MQRRGVISVPLTAMVMMVMMMMVMMMMMIWVAIFRSSLFKLPTGSPASCSCLYYEESKYTIRASGGVLKLHRLSCASKQHLCFCLKLFVSSVFMCTHTKNTVKNKNSALHKFIPKWIQLSITWLKTHLLENVLFTTPVAYECRTNTDIFIEHWWMNTFCGKINQILFNECMKGNSVFCILLS